VFGVDDCGFDEIEGEEVGYAFSRGILGLLVGSFYAAEDGGGTSTT
jgi:hypothetical protein